MKVDKNGKRGKQAVSKAIERYLFATDNGVRCKAVCRVCGEVFICLLPRMAVAAGWRFVRHKGLLCKECASKEK